jgi:hypothetical protein
LAGCPQTSISAARWNSDSGSRSRPTGVR